MFKKRFLQGLATSSILLVSLTIASFTMIASPLSRGMTGSLYWQHDWTVAAQASPKYHLDCFRRHYNFSQEKSSQSLHDVSNYFLNLG
jgi:hypothetical protein